MGRDLIPTTAKSHPFFTNIFCDVDGSVYSLKTGRKRNLWKTRHGYLQISLTKGNGTIKTSYLVHRLIADTFIENPENKKTVNHKNGLKDDNRVDNLEWATQQENVRHARDILGVKFVKSGFEGANARFLPSHYPTLINLYKLGFSFKRISEIMEFSINTITRHFDAAKNNPDSK